MADPRLDPNFSDSAASPCENKVVESRPIINTSLVEPDIYSEVSSVASGVETTIVSYTVPIDTIAYLQYSQGSGENVGTYRVKINGTEIAQERTHFGSDLNAHFNFIGGYGSNGKLLSVGDVVILTIEHNRTSPGDFSGRLKIMEI